MNITKVYQKGSRAINEDCFVINEHANIYAAIDGATGLDGGIPGKLASETFQSFLLEEKEQRSLSECIKRANKELNKKVISYYQNKIEQLHMPKIEYIPKRKRSTTGIIGIQFNEDHSCFDYVHAGDCMLFLKFDNDEIRMVTYDMVHFFDQIAINKITELRKEFGQEVELSKLRELVNPILLENREKYNTSQGYRILDGSQESVDQLECGTIQLNKVKGLLLLSDGLLLPTQSEKENGWEQSANIAFSSGLDALLTEVQKKEKEDKECIIYPRLKQQDDKTGILIEM
ncbi:hypothetical protein BN1058_01559 [Paraliobacillus sp. PM-2]|uniref:hypothetical protein n=1 Tax=Paraliobacillus sp. PM-2 TaxID=1462524 RepID=UPI00061CAD50|nr:hypothetical protein [Paraliobacillus sp. PM-2]CQR47252.1 hypothetical protein BN1058_01559 [Paraliobacillus sp. PM-2]